MLLESLEDFLSTKDHEVACARNGKDALEKSYSDRFDIYIFDINLPDISGIECLKLLRESDDKTPAVFLTSSTDQEVVRKGFLNGADDYIKKPFDADELSLRIDAILSRTGVSEKYITIDNNFTINPRKKLLLKDGEEFPINQKDFELLYLLVENRGLVVTKQMITNRLWSASQSANEGAVRVYVNNLKKLFGKNSITNIRGIGYRFEDIQK